jgi:hypothetical protein
MNERIHFAEGEQLLARREAENFEHRIRPINPAACEIPIPQAASSAIERGVHARAHHVVDFVGFARARSLPVKCKAEDQQDEAGRRDERYGDGRVREPAIQRACL